MIIPSYLCPVTSQTCCLSTNQPSLDCCYSSWSRPHLSCFYWTRHSRRTCWETIRVLDLSWCLHLRGDTTSHRNIPYRCSAKWLRDWGWLSGCSWSIFLYLCQLSSWFGGVWSVQKPWWIAIPAPSCRWTEDRKIFMEFSWQYGKDPNEDWNKFTWAGSGILCMWSIPFKGEPSPALEMCFVHILCPERTFLACYACWYVLTRIMASHWWHFLALKSSWWFEMAQDDQNASWDFFLLNPDLWAWIFFLSSEAG